MTVYIAYKTCDGELIDIMGVFKDATDAQKCIDDNKRFFKGFGNYKFYISSRELQ